VVITSTVSSTVSPGFFQAGFLLKSSHALQTHERPQIPEIRHPRHPDIRFNSRAMILSTMGGEVLIIAEKPPSARIRSLHQPHTYPPFAFFRIVENLMCAGTNRIHDAPR